MQEKAQHLYAVDGRARRPVAAHPTPPAPTPAGLRFSGHWEELLWDLACLGEVWLELAAGSVVTSRRTALATPRVRDGIGHLCDGGMALRLLLDGLRGVQGAKDGVWTLTLSDLHGQDIATLRGDRQDGNADLLWRTLLAAHGGIGRSVEPAPAAAPVRTLPFGDARDGRVRDLERRTAGLDDGIGFLDFAELAGLISLHPKRLRDRGRLVNVDPDLVPCVLSAVVDHLAPLQLTVGNGAVVQRLTLSPFAARLDAGTQYLFSERTRVRIDFRAVDSAWVFQPEGLSTRELRLYDDDGRAMAVIGTPEDPDGREPAVWRTLINALSD
jgi:hypothetical protein